MEMLSYHEKATRKQGYLPYGKIKSIHSSGYSKYQSFMGLLYQTDIQDVVLLFATLQFSFSYQIEPKTPELETRLNQVWTRTFRRCFEQCVVSRHTTLLTHARTFQQLFKCALMQPSKKIRSLCPQKWVQVLMMMMAIRPKVLRHFVGVKSN